VAAHTGFVRCIGIALLACGIPVGSASAATPAAWRIAASPKPITDALGHRWSADKHARGGHLLRARQDFIDRTASPQLYRTSREGVRGYRLPLRRGTYVVTLHMAENAGHRPGQRVFDVTAEGATVAGAVDLAAVAGQRKAWQLVVRVPVTDGALNLGFVARRGRPTVSAVEVRRMSATTAPPAVAWADDFDGPAGAPVADSRWEYYTGVGNPPGWGANELETYTYRPDNVALTGTGNLAIVARPERFTGVDDQTRDYTSGRIGTDGRLSYTHGLLQARIRMPAGKGLWPAFWLVGDNIDQAGWPEAGEIDIAELLGSEANRIYGSVHGPRPSGRSYGINRSVDGPARLDAEFHTYSVLRVPGAIQLALDGRPYAAYTRVDLGLGRRWVFDHPFRLALNVAVGGIWDGSPDKTTQWPATMLVDYVRLWQ
jgi:beta-glucanase (GH16 family)